LFHPHLHCVIPGGGLSPDHTQWIHPQYAFLLPIKVLGKIFRGKFVDGLRLAFRGKRLTFAGQMQHLAESKHFSSFLRTLFRQDWVVYAKPAFGGPEQVVRYLGRYTHRVAISNHRLLSFDGNNVTFLWRDYAHGNKQKKMTVSADEFIRRFLLHVLPKGFVRIRHFGFLANSQRAALLDVCRRSLQMTPVGPSDEPFDGGPSRLCPTCRRPMIVVKRLRAAEILWRFVSRCFSDTS
jgi:hypothetical protein